MNKELGHRIRARRERLGLTQSVVADAVDRSHSWLSALENGKDLQPPSELLTSLALVLDDDPGAYLRLAGRVALVAEGLVPMSPLDPRISAEIEEAVGRAMERLSDRLIAFLDERLPPFHSENGGVA